MTREELRQYNRNWRAKQKQIAGGWEKMKHRTDNANLKHNHGITFADFKERLANQGNVCAICGRSPNCQQRRFSVDHNHKTGQLRGILCSWCNRIVVPLFENYPQIIEPAKRYLNKYNGETYVALTGGKR